MLCLSFSAGDTPPVDAEGTVLVQANPTESVTCERVEMYGRARKMTLDQFRRILAVVPKSPEGARDLAWLLFHVLTARRRAEVAALQWDHLEMSGPIWYYRYRGKGGKRRRREVPPPVVEALRAWRTAADILANMEPALVPRGNLWGLCESTLAKHLKRYAEIAGLDVTQVHVHGLRHLAAALRKEDGADVQEIQEFLDHSSMSTTQIYLERLEETRDHRSSRIAEQLGL